MGGFPATCDNDPEFNEMLLCPAACNARTSASVPLGKGNLWEYQVEFVSLIMQLGHLEEVMFFSHHPKMRYLPSDFP